MATLAPPLSPSSPPLRRRTKSYARRCERYCCVVATYFPLAFVYAVSTWAVWVEATLGFVPSEHAWSGPSTSLLGILLYILLNTSYTVAVFTDPGSPVDTPASRSSKRGYAHLPTTEPRNHVDPSITSVMVSSTGAPRFCKKCLSPKPDRAHHCSTCRRCVLKMDHHCPWLATCVGLHNYKAFLLFLIYVSLFCWLCLAVTSQWIWAEILSEEQYLETLMPINVVMLGVISGIIGLVLTGFTIWHITLACKGTTTIESLEKTRYLTPMRNAHQQQLLKHQNPNVNGAREEDNLDFSSRISDTLHKAGEQMLSIHANVVPGATRVEEGEEYLSLDSTRESQPRNTNDLPSNQTQQTQYPPNDMSPAQLSLSRYSNTQVHHSRSTSLARERRQYEEYLDEEYTSKLPHAFNLGLRRNLVHLFGPNPWLWWLPVCNTTGDGWRWEVSQKWIQGREELAEEREREEQRLGLRGGEPRQYERSRDDYASDTTHITQNYYGRNDEGDEGGMSMRTLDFSNDGRRKSRAQKRDFDRSGVTGEVETFVVSGSSSDADEGDGQDHVPREDPRDDGWKRW